ncbi:hypothetical protein ATCVGM07011_573L [Acanthocystis turfacea Chlorella virus GM0701.1]|nr:hypothetical protein ATCVGM07011_573L [Acanthocystis turfacea Chlorella virus GM0701.1]AGE59807.1 hypothetical protein ATCVTN60342_560L [Acanthocystis turfacea Chlorella virus TN603.4.2]
MKLTIATIVGALAIIAFVVYVLSFRFRNQRKKENYMSGATLGPLLRSPNSETHDVLEWSLGGFGGSPKAGCPK